MIKKSILAIALVLSLITLSFGQASSASRLAWNIVGPSLAVVQAYSWRYYADQAVVSSQPLNNVTCTGTTSPYTCSTPFPPFTPGPHKLSVTAYAGGQESLKSNVLNFVFSVAIGTPTELRLAPAVP